MSSRLLFNLGAVVFFSTSFIPAGNGQHEGQNIVPIKERIAQKADSLDIKDHVIHYGDRLTDLRNKAIDSVKHQIDTL